MPDVRRIIVDGLGTGAYRELPADAEGVFDLLMPIVDWDGSALTWLGTGFSVAHSGLLMTAGHVLRMHLEEYAAELRAGTRALYALWETDRALPELEPSVPSRMGAPLQ